MKALVVALALLPAVSQGAESKEFVGKLNNLRIGKTGSILLGVKQDEENPLVCREGDWPIGFHLDQAYAQNWLDFLMLARSSNQTIRLGYLPDSSGLCELEYVAAMQGDGFGDIGDEDDLLVETGALGNVALINSNGLTEESYIASGYYGSDVAAAAFDGHTFDQQINDDAGESIHRGLWLIKLDKDTPNWLQIDFGRKVKIAGMRVVLNQKSTDLGRGPRDVTLQVSNDGESYADHESFRLSRVADQTGSLASPVSARYFRLKVINNHGDRTFIEIDELELFQKQQ